MNPFDAKYTHKDQAGVGFFATAHRQFMVRFTLKPIRSTNYIQIVNSYFARLDFHTGQLIEEVGYLHSGDVRQLLQERDVPFLYNTDDNAEEQIDNSYASELTHNKDDKKNNKRSKNIDNVN